MNLIDNAIKYTEEGGTIILKVEEYLKHNLIYITIADSGIGMTPEILNQI